MTTPCLVAAPLADGRFRLWLLGSMILVVGTVLAVAVAFKNPPRPEAVFPHPDDVTHVAARLFDAPALGQTETGFVDLGEYSPILLRALLPQARMPGFDGNSYRRLCEVSIKSKDGLRLNLLVVDLGGGGPALYEAEDGRCYGRGTPCFPPAEHQFLREEYLICYLIQAVEKGDRPRCEEIRGRLLGCIEGWPD